MDNPKLPTVEPRKFNRLSLKQHKPLVQTLHDRVRGRVRYKVRGLQRSANLQRYLEFKLSREPGIERVHASSCTGNILILFTKEYNSPALATLIATIVNEYRQQPSKATGIDLK